MPITYKKLFQLLDKKGLNLNFLRKNGISPSIIEKMQKGKGDIDTRTIKKLCQLLECQPGDIMEYIPKEAEQI